jgi:hypothetical protein
MPCEQNLTPQDKVAGKRKYRSGALGDQIMHSQPSDRQKNHGGIDGDPEHSNGDEGDEL